MAQLSNVHESVTRDRIIDLAKESMFGLNSIGLCLACGEECDNVEPDARMYTCECCGEQKVWGAEELMIILS